MSRRQYQSKKVKSTLKMCLKFCPHMGQMVQASKGFHRVQHIYLRGVKNGEISGGVMRLIISSASDRTKCTTCNMYLHTNITPSTSGFSNCNKQKPPKIFLTSIVFFPFSLLILWFTIASNIKHCCLVNVFGFSRDNIYIFRTQGFRDKNALRKCPLITLHHTLCLGLEGLKLTSLIASAKMPHFQQFRQAFHCRVPSSCLNFCASTASKILRSICITGTSFYIYLDI